MTQKQLIDSLPVKTLATIDQMLADGFTPEKILRTAERQLSSGSINYLAVKAYLEERTCQSPRKTAKTAAEPKTTS